MLFFWHSFMLHPRHWLNHLLARCPIRETQIRWTPSTHNVLNVLPDTTLDWAKDDTLLPLVDPERSDCHITTLDLESDRSNLQLMFHIDNGNNKSFYLQSLRLQLWFGQTCWCWRAYELWRWIGILWLE